MKYKRLLNTIKEMIKMKSGEASTVEEVLDRFRTLYPIENIEAINEQLGNLSSEFREKIQCYTDKYVDNDSVIPEVSGVDDYIDLTEMKSLVMASKELAEILEDTKVVEENNKLKSKDFCQMIMTACGAIEALIENSQ